MLPRAWAGVVFTLLAGAAALAGDIEPNLENLLVNTPQDEHVSVLVYLRDRVDIAALDRQLSVAKADRATRNHTVITALQSRAALTQRDLVGALSAMQRDGRVASFQPFWIVNAFRVDARPEAVRALAVRADVEMVYINYPIDLIEMPDSDAVAPPARPGSNGLFAAPEIGLVVIRAPEAWAAGYTGQGVVVANIDTGVAGGHESLASRWRGLQSEYAGHPEWAWLDPYLGDNSFPYDQNGHGTHTMGTICGGAPGDEIGVAPGSTWIAAAPIDRSFSIQQTVTDAIESFQWMVNPDGNPDTVWDVPHACGNSWGLTTFHGYPPCDQLFWSYIDASEAAGTAQVFAAGNEGASGLRRPGDRAMDPYRSTAVAAVDAGAAGWPIANFSSRGPTYCTPDGSAAIKPDVAAPGVNVRSAAPGGGYTQKNGTSMATPHVVGALALVLQACPDLGVDAAKQILYDTCLDRGTPGKDNLYGYGIIDVYAAVQLALVHCNPCSGDLDGDKLVGQSDLGILLANFGCTGGECTGDIDGDGDVDQSDLGILVSHYGSPCQ
ncbi:MAG: S8 family serine peptidase [Phycisphaerae bacterium]|nr:S8 family serine peptidase [Phycisphaerae bacterium]MCZ2398954.1 S8 family serine peptidase [Phycisphaerae bacterium]